MSGKTRHLLLRDGRYYARLVIPKPLRPYLNGKTELREPLGADRRQALTRLPHQLANFQHQIALAGRRATEACGMRAAHGRYPLSDEQIALRNYEGRLALDEVLRNDVRYASVGIDDLLVNELREGMAGRLSDDRLDAVVGERIERFRHLGYTTVATGTIERRSLARALCVSEFEALCRVAERDDGDFTGTPSHPMLVHAKPIEEQKAPLSIKGMFEGYMRELRRNGSGEAAEKRWAGVVDDLIKFVGSDDANRITRKTIIAWKDAKLGTLSPRTVKNVHLAAIKATFNWAVANEIISENPIRDIKIKVGQPRLDRPKGFTTAEATTILKASQAYVPIGYLGQNRELEATSAAKKWAPLLCAFTGSRISEITQLRKSDFWDDGDVHVLRITPEAGSVKTGQFRDVPLHPQVLALGFLDFVKAAPDGPLFYRNDAGKVSKAKAQAVSGRVSEWLQVKGVIPAGMQPNHGWRHAFKTIGRELEIDARIIDAIQGHAGRTAGDDYGDVTIKAKKKAIEKFPWFDLT